MRLIARFLAIARLHEHRVNVDLEGWVARPLNVSFTLHFHNVSDHFVLFQVQRLQNNDFDCGVWVLATIFAVVRGKHITGVREQDMDNLRHYLRTMVLALQVYRYDSKQSSTMISFIDYDSMDSAQRLVNQLPPDNLRSSALPPGGSTQP